jgi:hypothetical protein
MSGSLAIFAATGRASSRVSNFAADRRPDAGNIPSTMMEDQMIY